MLRQIFFAVATGALMAGAAVAERPSDRLNYGMLHWIADTVCTQGREIVFVPVSYDVPTSHQEWAVIGMDDPDPNSAHIVSLKEKVWLKANGCDEDPGTHMQIAKKSAESDGLDL